jgi:hypothetical protein
MAKVTVEFTDADQGRMPRSMCVMTGANADGLYPVRVDRSWTRWRVRTIKLPCSEAVFKKWLRRTRVMMRMRIAAIIIVVLAVAFSSKSPLLAFGFLIGAGLTLAVSLWAENAANELQPEAHRHGRQIELKNVHPRYVEVVEESGLATS